MEPNSEPNKTNSDAIKSSADFDKEMEEFFMMREIERSQKSFSNDKDCYKTEKEWDKKEPSMASGCCMTGCPNCPWGYTPKPE